MLDKVRRFFDFKGFVLNFNLIEDVGEFLVIEGEGNCEEILRDLGLVEAERVIVPFCDLVE